MKFGVFNVPYASEYAKGNRTLGQVIDWDIQVTKWADEFGLDSAFFAEHYTLGGEASPAPDQYIAACSQITERIKLGAAAHLVPYHNPTSLAFRMMWLDHMTGGRYIAGVAPGAYESDAQLFGTEGNNPKMLAEGLEIIERIISTPGPWTIKGDYFSADMPAFDPELAGPHIKPYQQPRFPLMVTGMQATSPTLRFAGSRGYLPLSQEVHEHVLAQHWTTYSEAAVAAGFSPKRADWRVCRDIFVADTDEEAVDKVKHGAMGELWERYNLATFRSLGILDLLTGGVIPAEDLTLDWMIEHFFLIGSPETVAAKIRGIYEVAGGFGEVVTFVHQYFDDADSYRHSLELLGTEVKPMLADLVPED